MSDVLTAELADLPRHTRSRDEKSFRQLQGDSRHTHILFIILFLNYSIYFVSEREVGAGESVSDHVTPSPVKVRDWLERISPLLPCEQKAGTESRSGTFSG